MPGSLASPRLVVVFALVVLAAAWGCKRDESSREPEPEGGGVFDGVVDDVDHEIKGADDTVDKAVEDVKGAGKDVGDAFSSDDDDESQPSKPPKSSG